MLDFLGIGAQKAGTTWLYEMLRLHPRIAFPATKEVHYWDMRRHDTPLSWYRAFFEGAEEDGTVKGEITPAYAILPQEVIKEIHAFAPDVRLIYMIRNPVQRAWSSALMALHRAEMRFEEAGEAWFMDHFRSRGSLARGDYETCLKNWLSVFEEQQMLVLHHDTLRQNPRSLLAACCRHLGVDAAFFDTLEESALHTRVFPAQKPVPLPPRLEEELHLLYKKKQDSLETYLSTLTCVHRP